ncbi:MAG: hypothetical protein DMG68_10665 [Acidobacteria bacterium]|nr:MAG: hypothetical protein DMG68_10665 [Acidobacteriota bacterium]
MLPESRGILRAALPFFSEPAVLVDVHIGMGGDFVVYQALHGGEGFATHFTDATQDGAIGGRGGGECARRLVGHSSDRRGCRFRVAYRLRRIGSGIFTGRFVLIAITGTAGLRLAIFIALSVQTHVLPRTQGRMSVAPMVMNVGRSGSVGISSTDCKREGWVGYGESL